MLKVQSLHKEYALGSEKVPVLKGVDLELGTKDRLAILGPSGSGKSSLLALIAGLDRPTSGQIAFGDLIISAASEAELERYRAYSLGVVFQQFHLLSHLSALENVALALRIRGEKAVLEPSQRILERVGLKSRITHKPRELSGGERQRVAIARAIVGKPPLILADEPSGNLDEETGEKVMNLLFEVCEEVACGLILVTHNEDLAKRCPRRVRMHQGLLKAES